MQAKMEAEKANEDVQMSGVGPTMQVNIYFTKIASSSSFKNILKKMLIP
jgi:hypothetical protein